MHLTLRKFPGGLRASCLACLLVMSACGAGDEPLPPTAGGGVGTTPVTGDAVAGLLQQADDGYRDRADLKRVREGLQALRRVRAVQPENYDAAWRMARLDYTLGDKSPDTKEQVAAFTEGIEAGETAARAGNDKPEGHFWYGANKGGYAESQGPLSGLSAAKELRKEMERVVEIDPKFQGGSAYMVLGRLDLELPELLGGSAKRALETLETGLNFGGDQNSLFRLRLAEAYLANKRPADARQQANFILNMKPAADFLPEYQESVEGARKVLAKAK